MAETKTEKSGGERRDKRMTRMVKAETEFVSDIAGAVSDGFRAFRDKVTEDNVSRFDFDNGILEGAVEGLAVGFEREAKALRSALDRLKPND